MIEVHNLTRVFRTYKKVPGFWGGVKGLFKREFEETAAAKDISFSITEGEFVGFLGPNGAGKTTTLKMLSGLIYPTSGTARVAGYDPTKRENAYRRLFALVLGQKNQLWWDLPAIESFTLLRAIYGIPADQFKTTLDELVDLLEVRPKLNVMVRELSLGERMKMELIAALLHSPDVLFLDEPTIGLDVIAQRNIQQFLKHYQQERQITILLTSHYMKDVSALCQRVVVIAQGILQYDGSLSGIIDSFSGSKVIQLQLGIEQAASGLERFGEILKTDMPRVSIRVPRSNVSRVLAEILNTYTVDDVAVEDPPLEEVIASLFHSIAEAN